MSLGTQEIERKYRALGFETQHLSDKPGTIYEPHSHGEVRIFTIKGTARVKLDNKPWQVVSPGQEITFHDGQLHEAIVGKEAWEYIFAASPEEMKRQGLA